MNLYAQELVPDTNNIIDEDENILFVHTFDQTTFYWVSTEGVEEGDLEEVENEYTTRVPIPEYNPLIQHPKFNTSSQLWEIIIKENPLDSRKYSSISKIDGEFSRAMRRLSSPIAQTTGLYELKYKESLQYIDDDTPDDLSSYPFLEMGVASSGMSAIDYANLTISKHDEYNNLLFEIENIRLQAKADIRAVEYDGTGDVEALIALIDDITDAAVMALINL